MNSEMRIFSDDGQRLYLTPDERQQFITAAKEAQRNVRTLCLTLAYTGMRISEALQLTADRVDFASKSIVIRSLKKRDKVAYRDVPVQASLLDALDLVHDVRNLQRQSPLPLLWTWHRSAAWEKVVGVMEAAGLDRNAPSVCPKGLRHTYGVHAIHRGVDLNTLKELLGHESIETTAIYARALGQEKRDIVSRMWDD